MAPATEDACYRQAFEALAVGMVMQRADGVITLCNAAAERILGLSRDQLLGRASTDPRWRAIREDGSDFPGDQHPAMVCLATGKPQRDVVMGVLKPDGSPRWLLINSEPLANTSGASAVLTSFIDITAQRQAEAAQLESEARFRQLAENIDSVFSVVSPDWRQVHYISPAYERIWGRPAAGLYRNGMEWFDAVLDEDRDKLLALIRSYAGKDWQSIEFPPYRIHRPDGSQRWIAARAFAIRDDKGAISRVAGIAEDVTERREHERHLEELAHYDILTHLPNRLLLADRMHQAMARGRRNGSLLATCLIDLDGFKLVNDRLGHEAGDRLLVEVARRLLEGVRGDDTVARLGGDEFVLLLGNLASVKELEETLNRLLGILAMPYTVIGQQVSVTASIGVTIFPNDCGDIDTQIRHADHAMYLAKQAGKSRFHLFNPVLENRQRENQQALRLIRRALEQEELRLHYQPIVDSRLGQVVAMEALLRWQHPLLGLLGPAEFLPLVEDDAELAGLIGIWVLRAALRQLRVWRQADLDISVSINMFPRQLHDPGFPAQLEGILREFPDVPPGRLTLEIVETAALEDMGGVIRLIENCKRFGMNYALDDFGTGYSSLTYLRRLPVHSLKIDQSFVRDMLLDPEDMTIVEGIIGLANAFRHRVVAEGVETADHALMLQEMGCHLVQGHGIARPIAAEDTTAWLRAYQPDPRWLANASQRLDHDDHQLVLAEVHHRQWINLMLAWGRTDTLGRGALPPLDSHECNFGKWYHGEGARRYGHLQPFIAIESIHEQLHVLAGDYIRHVQEANGVDTARQLEEALLHQRDQLLDALSGLRAAVSHPDAGQ
jgi:diguanylate cyclase (GGDEF)-like protein/PAS domain S-box-containing protein